MGTRAAQSSRVSPSIGAVAGDSVGRVSAAVVGFCLATACLWGCRRAWHHSCPVWLQVFDMMNHNALPDAYPANPAVPTYPNKKPLARQLLDVC